MIGAGKLKDRISIVTQSGEDDGFGHKKWQIIQTVRANVDVKNGTETSDNSAGHLVYEIKCRFRKDITYKSRIRYQNRDLELTQPPQNVRGLSREMLLVCKEVTRD
ncbi:head-tail adaptor protein [Catenovulum sediminis]|uniref:head-tail adaptor protein n=1 Tax=Catenovulum sediminis TaxID=1740262 RepID=UPI00117DBDBC|nr:head-tail adaptor protein [Catenovulum sediminis]